MARYARRLIYWISGSLLALLLLALLAIVVVVLTIDPDRFRGRIEAAASAAIGRSVQLTGGLHWRLGWRTAIESRGGEVANAPGFGAGPFAEWQSLRFGIALRPLLRRELQIDRVELVGARLRLQRNAEGQGNWNFTPAPESQAQAEGADAQKDLKIRIGSLALRDAMVSFEDAAAGRELRLAQISLDVELPPDPVAMQIAFGGLSLQGVASGTSIAAPGVPLSLHADAIHFDRAAGAIDVPAWTLRWADARLDGAVQARTTPSVSASGHLALQAPSLRELLATVSFPVPVTRDKAVFGKLGLASRVQWRDGAATLEEFRIALDDTEIAGRIDLPSLSPPVIRFELAADKVQVDRYLAPEDAPGEPFELPLEALKALDAKGVLSIREASMAGAAAKELRVDVE